tara:strand:- start:2145 stop:2519 length:375 start_codon:yes stop_codon:yes gene_type:complete
MAFKLGSGNRDYNLPWKKKSILRKNDLEDGVLAEANNDGTIYVDSNIPKDSDLYNRVIKHEMKHMEDMESGRADYGDDWVEWEGNIYFRREVDGEKMIDGPAGRLPEGHPDHPWEQSAIKAEKE